MSNIRFMILDGKNVAQVPSHSNYNGLGVPLSGSPSFRGEGAKAAAMKFADFLCSKRENEGRHFYLVQVLAEAVKYTEAAKPALWTEATVDGAAPVTPAATPSATPTV